MNKKAAKFNLIAYLLILTAVLSWVAIGNTFIVSTPKSHALEPRAPFVVASVDSPKGTPVYAPQLIGKPHILGYIAGRTATTIKIKLKVSSGTVTSSPAGVWVKL